MPLAMQLAPGKYRGTSPLVVNRHDGSVLVHVPAGKFEMGDGERPDAQKHMVELSDYWIGVDCVSNRQYETFVKEIRHRKPGTSAFGTSVWKNGIYPAEKADHPVVCVNWHDATAYAEWAGCQLPTEAQWEKATKGPLGQKYPWGKDYNRDLCRNSVNKGAETTASVSAYPKGESGYGTYQQSGNVWEWCRDWYEEGYYGKSPAKDPGGPSSGSARVYRGGSWINDDAGFFRAGVPQLGSPRLPPRLPGLPPREGSLMSLRAKQKPVRGSAGRNERSPAKEKAAAVPRQRLSFDDAERSAVRTAGIGTPLLARSAEFYCSARSAPVGRIHKSSVLWIFHPPVFRTPISELLFATSPRSQAHE